jgi:vacuolar-type H+-ATPase subunit H
MLAAAESEARTIVTDAHSKAEAELREAEAKLRRLEVEREAVSQYVENLKSVFERLQTNLNIR